MEHSYFWSFSGLLKAIFVSGQCKKVASANPAHVSTPSVDALGIKDLHHWHI